MEFVGSEDCKETPLSVVENTWQKIAILIIEVSIWPLAHGPALTHSS